jgi:hypothetical protein
MYFQVTESHCSILADGIGALHAISMRLSSQNCPKTRMNIA